MTKGFVTIATGDIKYYRMAYYLLLSYKYHTSNPLPFAIIAEEENRYTKEFDKVILTSEVSHSFMDKLLMLKLIAWDEAIFFDADTLAFGDLNEYWNVFTKATDFSSIGVNVGLNESGAWYDVDGIGPFGKRIAYKTRVHLGVAYIRNTDSIRKLYADCLDIYSKYDKLHIHTNPTCYDEVILGIAMPMNNMKAEPEPARMMACYPCLISLSGDMKKGTLSYSTSWGTCIKDNGILVHFGSANTSVALYRYSTEWLDYNRKSQEASLKDILLYQWRLRKLPLFIYDCILETKIFVSHLVPRMKKYMRKRMGKQNS